MRVIAYVRVSTSEQADSRAGPEAQPAAILREAIRRGWSEADVDWIEEAGFSAKPLKRPRMFLALGALRSREATTLEKEGSSLPSPPMSRRGSWLHLDSLVLSGRRV